MLHSAGKTCCYCFPCFAVLVLACVCDGAQDFSTSSPSTVSSTSGEEGKALQCMFNACMQLLLRRSGRAQYLRQSLQKQLCIHVGQGRCDAGSCVDGHAGLSVLAVRVSPAYQA